MFTVATKINSNETTTPNEELECSNTDDLVASPSVRLAIAAVSGDGGESDNHVDHRVAEGTTTMDLGENRDFRDLRFSNLNENEDGHAAEADATANDDDNNHLSVEDNDTKNNSLRGLNRWNGIRLPDHHFEANQIDSATHANTAAAMGMDQFGNMTFTLTSSRIANNNNNKNGGNDDDKFSSNQRIDNDTDRNLSAETAMNATSPLFHHRNLDDGDYIHSTHQDNFTHRRQHRDLFQRRQRRNDQKQYQQQHRELIRHQNSATDGGSSSCSRPYEQHLKYGKEGNLESFEEDDSKGMRSNGNCDLNTILPDCATSGNNIAIDANNNNVNATIGRENIVPGRKTFDMRDLMKLTPHHASRSKFPPGCFVSYDYHNNNTSGIHGIGNLQMNIGKVDAVFIDMSSRELIYSISSGLEEEDDDDEEDENGGENDAVLVDENSLQYAPLCPIYYQSNAARRRNDSNNGCGLNEAVKGTVLLCERKVTVAGESARTGVSEIDENIGDNFLYTILLRNPGNKDRYVTMDYVKLADISFRPKKTWKEDEVYGARDGNAAKFKAEPSKDEALRQRCSDFRANIAHMTTRVKTEKIPSADFGKYREVVGSDDDSQPELDDNGDGCAVSDFKTQERLLGLNGERLGVNAEECVADAANPDYMSVFASRSRETIETLKNEGARGIFSGNDYANHRGDSDSPFNTPESSDKNTNSNAASIATEMFSSKTDKKTNSHNTKNDVKDNKNTNVRVSGIRKGHTVEELRSFFLRFGNIVSVQLNSGQAKIEFQSTTSSIALLREHKRKKLQFKGNDLTISYCKKKSTSNKSNSTKKCILVSDLPPNIDEVILRSALSCYGEIESIRLGLYGGNGIVQFKNPASASLSTIAPRKNILGHLVKVEYAPTNSFILSRSCGIPKGAVTANSPKPTKRKNVVTPSKTSAKKPRPIKK